MKKAMLFFLILLSGTGLLAQLNLDSLYGVWQDINQPDSVRSKAYHNFIWKGYLFNNPDTAFTLAESLIQFSEEEDYPPAKVQALTIQGASFWAKGDYAKALEYYTQNYEFQTSIDDKKGSATALHNIVCRILW